MLIDWFTLVAQTLNFLILVWLLKRFLYQPILDAIDAREQRIADELANADKKQREAMDERDAFQKKNAAFDAQRQTLLKKASADADAERQRLFTRVREQADALREKRQAAALQEQQNLQRELRRLSSDEVFAIARKALNDLAGVSLEQSITNTFLKRLQAMDGSARESFTSALSSPTTDTASKPNPVLVRSAFDLSPEQQAAIQTALTSIFSHECPLEFDTTANVISGIELSVNGQKVAWSIAEYLDALKKNFAELVADAQSKHEIRESPESDESPSVAGASSESEGDKEEASASPTSEGEQALDQ